LPNELNTTRSDLRCQSNMQKGAVYGRAFDSREGGKRYAKRNFPVLQVVDRRNAVFLDNRLFTRGARNRAHAAWCYHQLAPIVEKVAPSVVTVFTTQTVSRTQAPFPFSDDALRQLFGGQLPQRQGKQTLQGLGSGVIVSADGYILTANHVVSGAEEIMIGLGTELRKYKGKKVGTDPGTDVALLKIDEKNLPGITFADSDKARAGDIVLAVGNPFGLRQTVTMGIINAVGRGGVGIVDYENFIQTDAAINMGNSGGALVDIKGELLGINTAIFSRSGGNQGVGFAIPANLARDVMQSLREKGRVVRGYIGASVQTLTPELA
jgi:S1-C subfamily serine protease